MFWISASGAPFASLTFARLLFLETEKTAMPGPLFVADLLRNSVWPSLNIAAANTAARTKIRGVNTMLALLDELMRVFQKLLSVATASCISSFSTSGSMAFGGLVGLEDTGAVVDEDDGVLIGENDCVCVRATVGQA